MTAAFCVIHVTVPDKKTAAALAGELVARRLAACVNTFGDVSSQYWWEGKIERADETLLVLKTRAALFPDIQQCIKELHPYEVPEIIALPILEGAAAYLDWIGANTLFTKPPVKSPKTVPEP